MNHSCFSTSTKEYKMSVVFLSFDKNVSLDLYIYHIQWKVWLTIKKGCYFSNIFFHFNQRWHYKVYTLQWYQKSGFSILIISQISFQLNICSVDCNKIKLLVKELSHSVFLILISLQPNAIEIRYFKLCSMLDQSITVWNIKGLHHTGLIAKN